MRKKLLFIIHTLGGGGAEKVLVNLVNHLDKNIYDITVMTVINTGIYRQDILPHVKYKSMFSVPLLHKINNKKEKSGSLLNRKSRIKDLIISVYVFFWKHIPCKWIYQIFIKEKYDVEAAFLEGICAKIISASTNPLSEKYVWIHVDLFNQHKSKSVFQSFEEEKKIYDSFQHVVCVSEYVKKQFLRMFAISEEKIIVKYNPIDRDEIIQKSRLFPEYPMVQKRKFTICSVGRLNRQKSYGRLLECHKQLIEQGYDYDLWIIGEGTDFENLIRFIVQIPVERYAHSEIIGIAIPL